MSVKKMFSRESGTSLIEILVAMTILSISTLAILTMFQVSYAQNHEAIRKTVAINMAKQKLEEYRVMDFGNITAVSQQQVVEDGITYYFQVNVDDISASHKKVHVQVLWPDRLKQYRTVEIDIERRI